MRAPTSSYAAASQRGVLGRLISLGVTPNMVSYAGLLFSLLAGSCLAIGAGHVLPLEPDPVALPTSWWPVLAGLSIGLASLADLLDGALARHGSLQSDFGAVLDSTLDRFGDMAIIIGCILYFARGGNVTFVLVSCVALVGSVQISYVKARAENYVTGLGIGFWQRGERCVAMLVGALSGRVATVLCIMAVFQLFTVLRRMRHARVLLTGSALGDDSPLAERVAPWRQRRGSIAYQLFCVAIVMAIVGAPRLSPFFYGTQDPLGAILNKLAG